MVDSPAQPFGKYLLLERIAAGGMAEIFRAKFVAAAGVTKPVVIKRILPHYAGNRAFVSMFINEAKIAVGLSHGNIAQVFDFGEVDGEYYLAMEFVDGRALSRIGRRAYERGYRIPVPIAAYLASQVCAGLHYAHTRLDESGRPMGIVHRDVSPQNVLVSWTGEVKIVDFGIAKMRSAGAERPERDLKGKYPYFSPEQAKGRALDARSDIFAAGIVLYEMLASRRPFEGKMPQVLEKIAKGQFLPPSASVTGVPRELEEIVLKAMAPAPESRFENALEMHDALVHFLHVAEPGFSASAAGQFVRLLFDNELPRDSVHAAVPEAFRRELDAEWRLPEGLPPAPVSASSDFLSFADEELQTRPFARWRELITGRGRWAVAALAGVLLGAGALGTFLLGAPRQYTLTIHSKPPGALVLVDEHETGLRTPAAVTGLAARRSHLVELRLRGRQPYELTMPPQRQRAVQLEVELAEAPPGQLDVSDPPEPAPDAPEARLPEQHDLTLAAQAHATHLPATPAARVRLDPRATYDLSVEGMARLAADQVEPLRSVFYFGESARGGAQGPIFGQLQPGKGATVTHVRALYGFVIDPKAQDNGGVLKIRIAERRGGRETTLLVDPAVHVVAPSEKHGRFSGLAPAQRYRALLDAQASLAPGARPTTTLLYFKAGATSGDSEQGVLVSGTPMPIVGAKQLWLLLPDDDRVDNEGTLHVQVTPGAVEP